MKKIYILFFCIMATAIAGKAQEFKKFKVGVGLGYAMASGNGSSGGVLAYLEPAYRLSDALSLGLRIETAVITRGFSEDIGTVDVDVAAIASYTANAQYYFNNNSFRPFVGAGLGLYELAAVSVDAGAGASTAIASEAKFGFYPRVGFDWGHFNLSIDYNFIPNSAVEGGGDIKNSYLGIRIGGFFGGGRK